MYVLITNLGVGGLGVWGGGLGVCLQGGLGVRGRLRGGLGARARSELNFPPILITVLFHHLLTGVSLRSVKYIFGSVGIIILDDD